VVVGNWNVAVFSGQPPVSLQHRSSTSHEASCRQLPRHEQDSVSTIYVFCTSTCSHAKILP